MRTLFCSHSHGVLIPPTPRTTGGTTTRQPASLDAKCAGEDRRPGEEPRPDQRPATAASRSNPKNGAPK